MAKQNSMIFRGVTFSADALTIKSKQNSPPFCVLHMRADLSKPVMEAMGWSVGDGQGGGSFIGELNGTNAILTPSKSALKDREVQFEVGRVGKFSYVPVKKKGEVTGHELTFEVRTSQADAPAIVMGYIASCGEEKAQLKLAYSKEPVQTEFPGTEEAEKPEAE